MNYFEFYSIPLVFQVNQAHLKKIFYANSKKYHPDFYTLETEEKQQEVLELSSLNNKAYNTLRDFDARMKYILELKKILGEEGNNQLPQEFLMEMMDINESIMELEFEYNQDQYLEAHNHLQRLQADIYYPIQDIIETYDDNVVTTAELEAIKDYYLKKRYLLRIQENLNKFATR